MARSVQMGVEPEKADDALDNVTLVAFDESGESLTDPPRGEFEVTSPAGVANRFLRPGDKVYLTRNHDKRFHGQIETPTGANDDEEGARTHFDLIQVGYRLLQAAQCTSFDFVEDETTPGIDNPNQPPEARDGVTINPWNFVIFDDADGPIDATGNRPALDGVTYDDVLRMLIGTKAIFQIDFTNADYVLPSQAYDEDANVKVFRDGPTDDLRPKLQRVREDGGFKTGGSIESIPLQNGQDIIGAPMGDISTVDVVLFGDYDGANDIQLELARDADQENPTYQSLTLSRDDDYDGSGLARWTGTIDLSGGSESTKNYLGFKITIPGNSGDNDTTKIHYLKLDATTESDTGITEGTIEAYANPVTFTSGGENYVATDLLGFNRLEAAERLRTQTESDQTINPSPHWDAWIDHQEQFHFKQRRGDEKTNLEYSIDLGNLTSIRRREYGGNIAYQTVAYGAGSGKAQTRIADRTEYTNGGLYDSDRDPHQFTDPSNAKYGEQAGVERFVDQNETSAINLLRKARAFHKLHRDPQVTFEDFQLESEYIPYFNVGDELPVTDRPTNTDEPVRVIRLRRTWQPNDGETLEPTLGEPTQDFAQRLRNARDKADTVTIRPQPNTKDQGVSGDGIYFDKDHYGKYTVAISDGHNIDEVFLKIETIPWQSRARTAGAGGDHSHSVNVDHPSHSHSVNVDHPSHSHSVNVDHPSHSHNVDISTTSNPFTNRDTVADDDSGLFYLNNQGSSFNDVYSINPSTNYEELLVWVHVTSAKQTVDVRLQELATSNYYPRSQGVALCGSASGHDHGNADNSLDGDGYSNTVLLKVPEDVGRVDVQARTPNGDPQTNMQVVWMAIAQHQHDVSDSETSDAALGTTTSETSDAALGTTTSETSDAALGTTTSETSDASGDHTHPLDFGIYQFDGDNGDGTGSPIYGAGIKLAVDPTVGNDGIPTQFATERLPDIFGNASEPVSIELPITGWLDTDDQGIIQDGQHTVFFLSGATTDNTDGLAVVSITPIVTTKEQQ